MRREFNQHRHYHKTRSLHKHSNRNVLNTNYRIKRMMIIIAIVCVGLSIYGGFSANLMLIIAPLFVIPILFVFWHVFKNFV